MLEGVSRRPHRILAVDQVLGESEEMLGEARGRPERNEASKRESVEEAKSTHLSNSVNCQAKSQEGPRST